MAYAFTFSPGSLQVKDKEIRGTKFVVPGLKEGSLYRFRVRAVNAAGVGDPGEVSDAIEVKDRTGEKNEFYIFKLIVFLLSKYLTLAILNI